MFGRLQYFGATTPKLIHLRYFLLLFVVSWGIFPVRLSAADNSDGDALIDDLNRTIEWYRRATSFDQEPINSREAIFHDSFQHDADEALRLGFEFAHGRAAVLIEEAKRCGPTTMPANRLAQSVAASAQRVAELKAELANVDHQLESGGNELRPVFQAQRDRLAAELNLATVRRDGLGNIAAFLSGREGSSITNLTEKIATLESTYPQVKQPSAQGDAAGVKAPAPQAFNVRSEGIIGLMSDVYAIRGRLNELQELCDETTMLSEHNRTTAKPMVDELVKTIKAGDATTQQSSTNPAILTADARKLDELADRFKALIAVTVPLREQRSFLDSAIVNLQQWHDAVYEQEGMALRYLFSRVGGLALAVMVVLILGKLWRRVTFRYITDTRRRRQFLVLRRILVTLLIIFILVASFVTEFGSLATFAGLITAGIALALQTVIVSGVASFFFMGRYGLRIGDRITVGGTTGDVIDIGLFRLYLMELGGSGGDLHPTGRIVVFSNAVLLQPAAFFKQLPGADYAWHEIALTLSPDSDHALAENELLGAVESVYSEYRKVIESQYAAVRESLHLPIPAPKPEGRLRFVDAGLEFLVRYPVEVRRASEIDDRITRKLLATIQAEPRLRMVASGTARIQAAMARPSELPGAVVERGSAG